MGISNPLAVTTVVVIGLHSKIHHDMVPPDRAKVVVRTSRLCIAVDSSPSIPRIEGDFEPAR